MGSGNQLLIYERLELTLTEAFHDTEETKATQSSDFPSTKSPNISRDISLIVKVGNIIGVVACDKR